MKQTNKHRIRLHYSMNWVVLLDRYFRQSLINNRDLMMLLLLLLLLD